MSIFCKCNSTPHVLGNVLQKHLRHYIRAITLYEPSSYETPIKHYKKLISISENSFKNLHGSSMKLICSKNGDSSEHVQADSVSDKGVDFSHMTADECKIHRIHQAACKAGQDTYIDPATGYTVLTKIFHIRKGKCCGNACRHCPYNHIAVPEEYRNKKFNSSFYV